jgi:hypothetical protein
MIWLTRMLARIRRVFHIPLSARETMWPMRRESRECCFDSDARRRAILAMRDECWRAGF